MSNINVAIIEGNCTFDPELKYTQSNTAVCELSIAVNRKYKNEEEVSFISVTCFGKTAEIVSQYVKKGTRLSVSGRLKQERWEKDGQKRERLKVIADSVSIQKSGGSTQGSNQGQGQPRGTQRPSDEYVPF